MTPENRWNSKWLSEMGLFWCISITNYVKSCKKINERVQTFRFSVFAMGHQEIFAENMENWANQTKTAVSQIFKYFNPFREGWLQKKPWKYWHCRFKVNNFPKINFHRKIRKDVFLYTETLSYMLYHIMMHVFILNHILFHTFIIISYFGGFQVEADNIMLKERKLNIAPAIKKQVSAH